MSDSFERRMRTFRKCIRDSKAARLGHQRALRALIRETRLLDEALDDAVAAANRTPASGTSRDNQ